MWLKSLILITIPCSISSITCHLYVSNTNAYLIYQYVNIGDCVIFFIKYTDYSIDVNMNTLIYIDDKRHTCADQIITDAEKIYTDSAKYTLMSTK